MKTTLLRGSLLAFALLLANPSWAIMLSLEPAVQIAGTGDTVSLDLVASDLGDGVAPSLGAYDLDILFDSSRLSLLSVAFGSGLNDPGDPDTPMFQFEGPLGPGVHNLAEVSLLIDPPADPTPLDLWQPDEFVIATLEFMVDDLEPGNSTMVDFGFVTLFDGFGDPFIDFGLSPALIRNPLGIGEPMTALLIAIGLLGVAATRRR